MNGCTSYDLKGEILRKGQCLDVLSTILKDESTDWTHSIWSWRTKVPLITKHEISRWEFLCCMGSVYLKGLQIVVSRPFRLSYNKFFLFKFLYHSSFCSHYLDPIFNNRKKNYFISSYERKLSCLVLASFIRGWKNAHNHRMQIMSPAYIFFVIPGQNQCFHLH